MRLAYRSGEANRSAVDGSAGKGRVLGQGDQARTGIGTARLPGIYSKE